MLILTRDEIQARIDWDQAIEGLKDAFKAASAGKVTMPPIGYLGFPDADGDCHIKSGRILGDAIFVVKVSTGFYGNVRIGLPSSNGLSMVFSAETGAPLALLQDEGWLTDLRTGLAGAIATDAMARRDAFTVAIVGTGTQARLQVRALRRIWRHRAFQVRVWGRTASQVDAYCDDMATHGIAVSACSSLESMCRIADVLITTTPSREPLVQRDWIRSGTHITAVGADAPGKQELATELVACADTIVVDSRTQCVEHGEIATAARDNRIDPATCVELGALLADPSLVARRGDDITIADLTGLAAQDIAIAKVALARG